MVSAECKGLGRGLESFTPIMQSSTTVNKNIPMTVTMTMNISLTLNIPLTINIPLIMNISLIIINLPLVHIPA